VKPNTINTPVAVDRPATVDEVRAASLPFSVPDPFEECAARIMREVAMDIGGHARIPDVDLEVSNMAEVVGQGKWLN
jgi:hypothetical protein